jgi:carbon-monoxide dehydrogenase medium subunit
MKPAPFEYHAPDTLDEALVLLAEHGTAAKPLAGGQSLIPAMNFRLAQPSVLVDLNRIDELSYIRAGDSGLSIGGMTRHRRLEQSTDIGRLAPLMSRAMPFVAHIAVRTRGTLGGSLAHADPAAELPAVIVALDGVLLLRSSTAARKLKASEFFLGLFTTALEPGELLVGVDVMPHPAGTSFAFEEVSRRHGDFALAGVAASVTRDSNGVCTGARIALFGVADRPVLALTASNALVGTRPTAARIRDAAEASARADFEPTSDIHASSDYRRHLAAALTARAVTRACTSLEAA